MAQWEEPVKRAASKKIARYLIEKGKNFSLRELTALDIREDADKEKVGNFYMQSVSVIDFLVASFGPASFTEFCRGLRDGKSIEDALRSAYPGRIAGLDELENAWKKYAGVN